MLLESALMVPLLILLLAGGMELGKIALTYYTLQKAMGGAARMASVLRGANFCDPDDPQITAIKDFIVYGPDGANGSPIVRSLTADQILITPERMDGETGSIGPCDCSGATGCLASDGGRPPDFVEASLAGGYPFQPHIPFRVLEQILLRPHARAPFGGQ